MFPRKRKSRNSTTHASLGIYLQGVQPVEPTGPNFTFKAQKAPDQGAGQVATRPRQSRRRQTSTFQPFQLSTDVSSPSNTAKGWAPHVQGSLTDKHPAVVVRTFHCKALMCVGEFGSYTTAMRRPEDPVFARL